MSLLGASCVRPDEQLTFEQSKALVCMSATDYQRKITDCGTNGTVLTLCSIDLDNLYSMACSDGNSYPSEEWLRFVCLKAKEYNRLLRYCENKLLKINSSAPNGEI